MSKTINLLDVPYNIAVYLSKINCDTFFRVVEKTVKIDLPVILVASNYNISATIDSTILKSPISYGIREINHPVAHFVAGFIKYSIPEGESLAGISKLYNYAFTTNTGNNSLFTSFGYKEIKESFLNRSPVAIIGGINHLAYNKDISPYIAPALKIPGLENSEIVGIETIDIMSQKSLKLTESYNNKNYNEIASNISVFIVNGLKIGTMVYLAFEGFYLNSMVLPSISVDSPLGFDAYMQIVNIGSIESYVFTAVALNVINLIPDTIVNDAIDYAGGLSNYFWGN